VVLLVPSQRGDMFGLLVKNKSKQFNEFGEPPKQCWIRGQFSAE